MPNLIPDSVLGFELGWAQPAGRLIWSSLLLVIGLVFVVALIKPPLERQGPRTRRGVPLLIGSRDRELRHRRDRRSPSRSFMVWVSFFGSIAIALLAHGRVA